MGARFLLLNCTPALALLYEAKGWVRYKPAAWDEGMGLQVPMVLVLDDLAFLQKVDPNGAMLSALRAAAASFAAFPDPRALGWLATLLQTRPLPLVSSKCHVLSYVTHALSKPSAAEHPASLTRIVASPNPLYISAKSTTSQANHFCSSELMLQ